MENCLVTKLKVIVNNPNLPVLETMQQFTLDAIAASGNNSMTDAQKFALNHLFYALGKYSVGEDRIWDKLEYILLPIISGSKDKVLIDYIDLTDRFENKANLIDKIDYDDLGIRAGSSISSVITLVKKTATTDVNGDNIFLTCAYSAQSTTLLNQPAIALQDNTTNKIYYYGSSTDNYGLQNALGESRYVRVNNKDAIRCINIRSFDTQSGTYSGEVIRVVSNNAVKYGFGSVRYQDYTPITFTNKNACLTVRNNNSNYLQCAILGESLSTDEAKVVVNAVNELRNAFYTEQE